MRVRIVEGLVAELEPMLGEHECAMIVDAAPEVQVGWLWSPEGCAAPPYVAEAGPDEVTVAHSYLLADAQTVGDLRNALVEILGL